MTVAQIESDIRPLRRRIVVTQRSQNLSETRIETTLTRAFRQKIGPGKALFIQDHRIQSTRSGEPDVREPDVNVPFFEVVKDLSRPPLAEPLEYDSILFFGLDPDIRRFTCDVLGVVYAPNGGVVFEGTESARNLDGTVLFSDWIQTQLDEHKEIRSEHVRCVFSNPKLTFGEIRAENVRHYKPITFNTTP